MRSGFEENTNNPAGVYGSADQLGYSLNRTPSWGPGETFNYVNEDTMVLGGALSEVFGQEVGQVAQAEIFGPLGMDAAWWTDSEGASLTYCCIDSTARDFARFGLLYARDGHWDGETIVPSNFVAESTASISFYGYYGMQWWILEDNVFAAMGLYGQNIYVYPQEDMVVDRLGLYTQVGNEKIRDALWTNYHDTPNEGAFDEAYFRELIDEALSSQR